MAERRARLPLERRARSCTEVSPPLGAGATWTIELGDTLDVPPGAYRLVAEFYGRPYDPATGAWFEGPPRVTAGVSVG